MSRARKQIEIRDELYIIQYSLTQDSPHSLPAVNSRISVRMKAFHIVNEIPRAFIPFWAYLPVAFPVFQVSRPELGISTEESKRLMCPAN